MGEESKVICIVSRNSPFAMLKREGEMHLVVPCLCTYSQGTDIGYAQRLGKSRPSNNTYVVRAWRRQCIFTLMQVDKSSKNTASAAYSETEPVLGLRIPAELCIPNTLIALRCTSARKCIGKCLSGSSLTAFNRLSGP